ncbi:hypothetical protein EV426DRAFT_21376 [Tirmania nivea]|nr:hypothetical protein EV426DRAFT_21376 [Tirmania nivea]
MVFNSADSQLVDTPYSSFMSRMTNRAIAPAVPSRPVPKLASSAASKSPAYPEAKPAAASKPSASPPAAAKSNGASAINNTNGLKRKAEEDISKPAKTQETGKLSSASTPATAAPVEPAKAPKKGSYMELLQRAKTQPKVPAGAIVNKPKVPVEPMKKKWQKQSEKERAAKTGGAAGRSSKSPTTTTSNGEKAGPKVADKGPLAKKPVVDAAAGTTKKGASTATDRKSTTPVAGAATSSKSKPAIVDSKVKTTATIRERDRSPPSRRDSREDGHLRGARASILDRPKPSAGKRYVYREDTDSDSDMEATGIDILEEEEISAKRARLEDIEQERLEKRLAAEKAARKKALIKRK